MSEPENNPKEIKLMSCFESIQEYSSTTEKHPDTLAQIWVMKLQIYLLVILSPTIFNNFSLLASLQHCSQSFVCTSKDTITLVDIDM